MAAGGVGQRTVRTGGGEGDTAKRAKVAVAAQGIDAGRRVLCSLAVAGKGLAEVGVAYRNAFGNPAGAVADGAYGAFGRAIDIRGPAAV